MQAIQTVYRGYRFRSRLEARWAVLFDHLGYEWEYEAEGYELDVGKEKLRWLPDFRLPTMDLLAEVKGSEELLLAERRVLGWAVDYNNLPANGLLLLGPIPWVTAGGYTPLHSILRWDTGVRRDLIAITANGLVEASSTRTTTSQDLPDDGDGPFLSPRDWRDHPIGPREYAAYRAARAARFEHDQRDR